MSSIWLQCPKSFRYKPSMKTPIVLLVGQSGSGKDTAADFMTENHGAVKIALADPIKRLAMEVFGFTEEQLWGPSGNRNEVDARYANGSAWDNAYVLLTSYNVTQVWIDEVFEGYSEKAKEAAREGLIQVFHQIFKKAEMNLTPRLALQYLGTEFARAQNRNVWVDLGIRTAFELLGGQRSYVRTVGLFQSTTPGPEFVVVTDGRFRNEIVKFASIGAIPVKILDPDANKDPSGHASEDEQKTIPDHYFGVIFENDKNQGLIPFELAISDLVEELGLGEALNDKYGEFAH